MGIPLLDCVYPNQKWFQLHADRGNIFASSAANLIGVNPYQRGTKWINSNFCVLRNPKLNHFHGNYSTRRGQHYEPYTRKVFENVTHFSVIESCEYQDEEFPWLYANPDGLVNDGQNAMLACPLCALKQEINNHTHKLRYPEQQLGDYVFNANLEIKNSVKELYPCVPIPHQIQMQIQMRVTGVKKCYYINSCINTDTARLYYMEYDENFMKWLMPQLSYLHEFAMYDYGEVDTRRFDMKPPKIKSLQMLVEISSFTQALGAVPPMFDEDRPDYKPLPEKREREESVLMEIDEKKKGNCVMCGNVITKDWTYDNRVGVEGDFICNSCNGIIDAIEVSATV